MEKLANQPTIELNTNSKPNTLYLDSLHNENKANLLEGLAKDACNVNKDVTMTEKKKPW